MAVNFSFAFQGIIQTAKKEQNFRFHLIIIIPVILSGFYLKLNVLEWGLIILSIFFVLGSELWNTSIERLCDIISKQKRNDKIGLIKDISAGAVLLSAVNAVIIGILIILVPLIKKITLLYHP